MGITENFSFNLETIPIDKRLVSEFRDSGLISGEKYLYALELYKLYDRKELIAKINDMVGLTNYVVNVDSLEPDNYFEIIESKYDVLIRKNLMGKYDVYCSMFNDVEAYALVLELGLSDYDLQLYRVTPYNWKLLKGEIFDSDYSSLLLFKRIIMDAVDMGATDVHFEHKMILNKETSEFELTACISVTYLKKYIPYTKFNLSSTYMSKMLKDIIEKECPNSTNDLDSHSGLTAPIIDLFNDSIVTLRFTGKPLKDGHSVCARIQNMKTVSLTIDKLGFPEYQQEILERIANKDSGLTLITGAKASGKNTTQFAIVNSMLKRPIKIQDFSSPPEVNMPIAQVDYMSNVDTLTDLCRLVKKEATDVIVLNEIPDKSVAFAVQDLVNSSIHVITTTHVDRIWQVPYKLYELYGDNYKNLISGLNAIITQKMFVKQCPHCSTKQIIMGTKLLYLEEFMQKMGYAFHYVNRGCDKCENGELKGAIQPYCEMMLLDDEIKSELLKCDHPYEMEAYIKEYMMSRKLSFEFSLTEAVDKGEIKIESLCSIV